MPVRSSQEGESRKPATPANQPSVEEDSLDPSFEVAKLLLDEWKWRHQHCWKSLQRFGITAIAIAAVPYAKAEVLQRSLGKGTLVFPLAAWISTLAAAWLFTAEYTRCRPAETKYYELLGKRFRPITIYGQAGTKRKSIGRATIAVFVIGSTIVSIANAMILIKVANLEVSSSIYWLILVFPLIISFVLAWSMTNWARSEIERLTNTTDK